MDRYLQIMGFAADFFPRFRSFLFFTSSFLHPIHSFRLVWFGFHFRDHEESQQQKKERKKIQPTRSNPDSDFFFEKKKKVLKK